MTSKLEGSTSRGEIYKAISKFQGIVGIIKKEKVANVKGQVRNSNPPRFYEYQYKYADISDFLDAIRPDLSECGLCVLQPTFMVGTFMYVLTHIAHGSGQYLEAPYPVCNIDDRVQHQDIQAALTYAKRGALGAFLGVAAEVDTGGPRNDETGGHEPITPPQEPSQQRTAGPPRNVTKPATYGTDEVDFSRKIAGAQTIPELQAISREIGTKNYPVDSAIRANLLASWDARRAAILAAKTAAVAEEPPQGPQHKRPADMENSEWLDWVLGVFMECKTMDDLANAWTTRIEPHFEDGNGRNAETRNSARHLYETREKAIR